MVRTLGCRHRRVLRECSCVIYEDIYSPMLIQHLFCHVIHLDPSMSTTLDLALGREARLKRAEPVQKRGAEDDTLSSKPAKGLEVQVHHLISLGGWNDVIYLSIYLLLYIICQQGSDRSSACVVHAIKRGRCSHVPLEASHRCINL
jgi:hypothetical protein